MSEDKKAFLTIDGEQSQNGIPKAPFVEDVEALATTAEDVDRALQQFQEAIAKYRFMQDSLQKTAASLKDKIPDIAKTLQAVQFLACPPKGDEMTAHFELNDTLYAEATINANETVYIWLGANTMVEYPIPEAQDMLSSRLSTAQESLRTTESNLEFIREQITTMEVNLARIYNWGVELKRTR